MSGTARAKERKPERDEMLSLPQDGYQEVFRFWQPPLRIKVEALPGQFPSPPVMKAIKELIAKMQEEGESSEVLEPEEA